MSAVLSLATKSNPSFMPYSRGRNPHLSLATAISHSLLIRMILQQPSILLCMYSSISLRSVTPSRTFFNIMNLRTSVSRMGVCSKTNHSFFNPSAIMSALTMFPLKAKECPVSDRLSLFTSNGCSLASPHSSPQLVG